MDDGGNRIPREGGSTGVSASGDERTLSIRGDGSLSEYQFTVSGDLRDDPDEGPLAGPDGINGANASGAIAGGTDGYLVTG
jgi:hypothetical protein